MIPGLAGGGPLFSDDCSNITPWTDGDTGDGASTQVTFDGESTFKLDSGTTPNDARRSRTDIVIPQQYTATIRVYNDLVGAVAAFDNFGLQISNAANTIILDARFASDGLFINDGTSNNEVGTNIVVLDEWAIFSFVVNFDAATVDVYKNGVLQGTGFALRTVGTAANRIIFLQFGSATSNQISYVDWITIE